MREQLALGMVLVFGCGTALAQGSIPSSKTDRQAAITWEQQGNIADAEKAWRSIAQSHPSDAEAFAHLGLLQARQENYKEAIANYRKAKTIKSDFPGLRLNLGLALFKSGQLRESIPEFLAVLTSTPRRSAEALRLHVLLGMAHYGLGEFAQAVPYLKQALEQDGQNLSLRLTLAHSCLWSKQYQCVLDDYKEILRLNAESAEADMLAGEALDEMKDRAGAVEQFRAAVKANPKEPNVHFGLGYLLWAQRNYPEAASEFQAELGNDPSHAQSMLYLGDCYLQQQDPEKARPFLQRAAEIDPSLWMAYLDLGIVDSDAGRKEDAFREMQQAARLKPDEVNVHWRLARLYRAMGKTQEAKAEFEKANTLNKSADEDLVRKMTPHAGTSLAEQSKHPSAQP